MKSPFLNYCILTGNLAELKKNYQKKVTKHKLACNLVKDWTVNVKGKRILRLRGLAVYLTTVDLKAGKPFFKNPIFASLLH
jgi:hypothetical protein